MPRNCFHLATIAVASSITNSRYGSLGEWKCHLEMHFCSKSCSISTHSHVLLPLPPQNKASDILSIVYSRLGSQHPASSILLVKHSNVQWLFLLFIVLLCMLSLGRHILDSPLACRNSYYLVALSSIRAVLQERCDPRDATALRTI